ncbi:SGT1-domain-containing protein [Delitschia confertaspora ATCC 74209]|uniref:SGT1-domain-containing protein n=1 Tax=Delitschia confertaspora ATCC 74209 TaxID=1513339 RepID=A0A9P4MNF8_9PLEO|nr:SGT1-domain-containing protein [Delitschia confertaspora ATCC 74209]
MAEIPPKDDFKWFGEGFQGFPKHLPEDVVEYIIFVIDSKLSDVQTRERLQAFKRAMSDLEKKFLKEYTWQREGINLELIREEGRWALQGRTNYGDSVADEWLIVYFLRELSKQFPDAWLRIYDTDGEFLLIEAANALPQWINPEIAENRVWINSHKLLLIPLEPKAAPKPLSLSEAFKTIRTKPNPLIHLEKVEKEAFHRLSNYPAAISSNQHHATLPLPRKLAAILHTNLSYISPAVEAFYLRDPISLRLIQPKHNPKGLTFPPEDWVTVSVRFTRVLYAQLRSQEWVPPEPWGAALAKLLLSSPWRDSRGREKAEMGVKLAVGFEMLLQSQTYADKKAVREIQLLLEDITSGEEPLPTDTEIEEWGKREDDEAWLDINFEDFEKELSGKGNAAPEGLEGRGFGDKAAQENLRKMVERFEDFLKDEDAGLEGAQGLDDMDMDNDSDISDGDSDAEDGDHERDIEFDENEFSRLLREMMGMPSSEKETLTSKAHDLARIKEVDETDDIEAEEIRKLSERMEAELNEHGALNLDPTPRKLAAAKDPFAAMKASSSKGKGKEKATEPDTESDVESNGEEEELDIDFNLAKNLLESFKGQGGMAGPAGNLMGLMGLQFPRDEAGDDDEPGRS